MIADTLIESPRVASRILIVEDHPLFCRALAELIADEPDLTVCGQADSADAALGEIRRLRPHLAIVDLGLKDSNGLRLIEEIRNQAPQTKVLVASAQDEAMFAERVLRAGALGYVNKQEAAEVLVAALRQVLRGEVYLSPPMLKRILRTVPNGRPLERDPITTLSARELEVFEMIGRGLSTKQIARRLHLGQKTVETHREHVKRKLGIANAIELVRHAVLWVLQRSTGGSGAA